MSRHVSPVHNKYRLGPLLSLVTYSHIGVDKQVPNKLSQPGENDRQMKKKHLRFNINTDIDNGIDVYLILSDAIAY